MTTQETDNEILKYLSEYRLREEVQDKFKLSNVESWHCLQWLENTGQIESLKVRIEGRKGRGTWIYKAKLCSGTLDSVISE